MYHVEADGTATLLHTVGCHGAGLKLFSSSTHSRCACRLLVCDNCNGRVQELTELGEAELQYAVFIPASGASTIAQFALHGDTLAVGAFSISIQLVCYTSGALVRSAGSNGAGPGQIGGYRGRFTLDGQSIIAAELISKRVSMIRVCDRSIVKHSGVAVVADGHVHIRLHQTVSRLSLKRQAPCVRMQC